MQVEMLYNDVGPDRSSSSGAGSVGTGQLLPVPTGEAGTAAASTGASAVVPVQPDFPAGIQSMGMGHSVSTPAVWHANIGGLVPDYSGRGGLVYSAAAPMVSAGIGASVDDKQPASVPFDTSRPGMAGFVPFAARSLVNGGYSLPAVGSAYPTVAVGVFPRAGPPGSVWAPHGVRGLARGTGPVTRAPVPAPPVTGASASGGPEVGTDTANSKQVKKVLMKLMTYDGTGSLETFLAKFARLAEYMRWDDTDRYYHLCASLEGIAGQVLWDAGPEATVSDVITLLRTRFGNELQAERFRAELRSRRCQPRESLQQVYLDVSRLVALAYPAATPELSSHVAKEAFIEALNDPQLQLKVMEWEPKLVEGALNIATRLEAYAASLVSRNYDRRTGDFRAKPKVKATYALEGEEVSAQPEAADNRSQGKALIALS